MSEFLDDSDVKKLTGCARKSDQIKWLRLNGILHYVNKAGRPVVPKSAANGGKIEEQSNKQWQPAVINS